MNEELETLKAKHAKELAELTERQRLAKLFLEKTGIVSRAVTVHDAYSTVSVRPAKGEHPVVFLLKLYNATINHALPIAAAKGKYGWAHPMSLITEPVNVEYGSGEIKLSQSPDSDYVSASIYAEYGYDTFHISCSMGRAEGLRPKVYKEGHFKRLSQNETLAEVRKHWKMAGAPIENATIYSFLEGDIEGQLAKLCPFFELQPY